MLTDERDAAVDAAAASGAGGASAPGAARTALLRRVRPDHEKYKRIDQDLENKRNLAFLVSRRRERDDYHRAVIPLDEQGMVLDFALEETEMVPTQFSGFDVQEEEIHEMIGEMEEESLSEEEMEALMEAADQEEAAYE